MSLTFQRRQTPTGEYWRVLWNGRQAGMIVLIGLGDQKEAIVFRCTDKAYTELTRTKTVFEAKEWLRNKVKIRG